jgi:hypothetical protein
MNRHYCFVILFYHAVAHLVLRTAYNDAAVVIGMWGITRPTWKLSIARILVEGGEPTFWWSNFAAS